MHGQQNIKKYRFSVAFQNQPEMHATEHRHTNQTLLIN